MPALVGARLGLGDRGVQRGVGKFAGLRTWGARPRLYHPQARHRSVASRSSPKPLSRSSSATPLFAVRPTVSYSMPMLAPTRSMSDIRLCRSDGRIVPCAVGPDDDVLDDGGVARLAQVRRAGQQCHLAIALHHKALEEAEAERVVAGEPVHAFLREQQHAVELALGHGGDEPSPCAPSYSAFEKCSAMTYSLIIIDRNLAAVVRLAPVCRAPVRKEPLRIGIGALACPPRIDAGGGKPGEDIGGQVEKGMARLAATAPDSARWRRRAPPSVRRIPVRPRSCAG